MGDDEDKRADRSCAEPERADVELSEGSIKSLGFSDTDRPPTDPFDSAAAADSSDADSTDSE